VFWSKITYFLVGTTAAMGVASPSRCRGPPPARSWRARTSAWGARAGAWRCCCARTPATGSTCRRTSPARASSTPSSGGVGRRDHRRGVARHGARHAPGAAAAGQGRAAPGVRARRRPLGPRRGRRGRAGSEGRRRPDELRAGPGRAARLPARRLWVENGKLYRMSAAPVIDRTKLPEYEQRARAGQRGGDPYVGAVILADEVDLQLAQALEERVGAHVAFFTGGQLVVSSISLPISKDILGEFARQRAELEKRDAQGRPILPKRRPCRRAIASSAWRSRRSPARPGARTASTPSSPSGRSRGVHGHPARRDQGRHRLAALP